MFSIYTAVVKYGSVLNNQNTVFCGDATDCCCWSCTPMWWHLFHVNSYDCLHHHPRIHNHVVATNTILDENIWNKFQNTFESSRTVFFLDYFSSFSLYLIRNHTTDFSANVKVVVYEQISRLSYQFETFFPCVGNVNFICPLSNLSKYLELAGQ